MSEDFGSGRLKPGTNQSINVSNQQPSPPSEAANSGQFGDQGVTYAEWDSKTQEYVPRRPPTTPKIDQAFADLLDSGDEKAIQQTVEQNLNPQARFEDAMANVDLYDGKQNVMEAYNATEAKDIEPPPPLPTLHGRVEITALPQPKA